MDTAEELRARLDEHLLVLRAASRTNEFLDLAAAEDLHLATVAALDDWASLSGEMQRMLAHAIDHLVTVDDGEHDVASPIGLDDDREVVERALRAIRSG